MDNEWKNSLRERFSDYSAPEPEGLWEGIEQGMAGKPRRKMLPVWLLTGLAAAAAVALVVFLPTRKTMEPDVLQKQGDLVAAVPADVLQADTTVASSPTEASTASSPADTPTPSSTANTPITSSPAPTGALKASSSDPFAVASRHTLLSEAEPTVTVPVSGETVPDAVHKIVRSVEIAVNQKKEVNEMPDQIGHDERTVTGYDERAVTVHNKQVLSEQEGQVMSEKTDAEETVEEALRNMVPSLKITRESAPKRKHLTIGAYHEGGGAASLETSRGIGLARTGEYLATRSMPDPDVQGATYSMMNMLSSNRESTYWATHRAPVRVGVTAAWPLTDHLSLVSGLTWTSLSSHFNESTEGDTRMAGTQDLGYLGVPLRLEAGWEPVKRLRLYAGAGGMVEKGLLATVKADSYLGGRESTSMTSHPDMGGLLWSVGAEAGAEYRFGKVFGVYVAPGVEYHFDNGAEVHSAYTEKPLHWNLDIGVRFHFGG
jgi:hypothetical protein